MSFSAMQFLVWVHRAQLGTAAARVRFLWEVAFPVIACTPSEVLRGALVAEVVEAMNEL